MARSPMKAQMLVGFITVLVVVAGLGCMTTITGSKNLVTEAKTFEDFTAVDAEKGFNVTITQGSEYSITITTDDNVMKQVTVSRTGGKLFIGLKPGSYESVVLRANITMPELDEVSLSGGAQCSAKGFDSAEIKLTLTGGSQADMEGSADDLTIDASGGSQLDLSQLQVKNADVTLIGGSQVTINIDGTLDADLNGGSQLYYIGEPTMGDIQTEGGSKISKQ